jgi:hypothetical protein
MRRLSLLAVLGLAATLLAPAASAGPANRCAERFPESPWETSAAAGPVMVHGSGLTEPVTERFANDFEKIVVLIEDDMGGLEGTAVCLFEDSLPLEGTDYGWPPSLEMRAIAFGEEKMVVLSTWLLGVVPDAGRHGLLHVAQWQATAGPYPEPFGDDVKGWYRNRLDGTVEATHSFFVRLSVGEPFPEIPWTAGQSADPMVWNAELGYGGGGDFANFAVSEVGTSVLTDPFSADMAALDEQWRAQLSDEAGNEEGGTKGWVVGLIAISALLAVTVAMIVLNRYTRKRIERELREAVRRDRLARHQEEEEALVRPSTVSVGGGGGHTRVGSGTPRRTVDGDDRNRPPSGSGGRSGDDTVAPPRKSGDDPFRHPGFDGHD